MPAWVRLLLAEVAEATSFMVKGQVGFQSALRGMALFGHNKASRGELPGDWCLLLRAEGRVCMQAQSRGVYDCSPPA